MLFFVKILSHGAYGEVVNTIVCGTITHGFDSHYAPQNEVKWLPKVGAIFLLPTIEKC